MLRFGDCGIPSEAVVDLSGWNQLEREWYSGVLLRRLQRIRSGSPFDADVRGFPSTCMLPAHWTGRLQAIKKHRTASFSRVQVTAGAARRVQSFLHHCMKIDSAHGTLRQTVLRLVSAHSMCQRHDSCPERGYIETPDSRSDPENPEPQMVPNRWLHVAPTASLSSPRPNF